MKKLLQFVALALVLLVAAQPLLAKTSCAKQPCVGDQSVEDCRVFSDTLAKPDSAMPSTLANPRATVHALLGKAGCNYGSCCLAWPTATSQMAAPPKSRLASSDTPFTPIAQFVATPTVILAARASENLATHATAKYILFQVFRI